jgi:hypothetical protein
MKIKFDKLITDSENINVQYNQNLSKTYSVKDIKSSNNEITFSTEDCIDLHNIKISTDTSNPVTPKFSEENEYDMLFEYFNGCKTKKWVIDKENFPNIYNLLSLPPYVFQIYDFYKNDDIEIDDSFKYVSFSPYEHYSYFSSLSAAKEFRDDNPLNCDSNIYYKDENGEYQVYDESDTSLTPSTYFCLIKYETNNWSIYDFNSIIDTIIIEDTTYSIIYYQDKYYLVNKDKKNDISSGDCMLLNVSDEMPESYVLRAKPKYVYLEETEDTSDGCFYSYNDINSAPGIFSLSDFTYRSYGNKYKMILTTEFTKGSFQIIENSNENENIFNEIKSLINDQINSYKVFVDGYDLKNNLEISKKLFFILGKIQYVYSRSSRIFPYISFNSFHDKTLEYLGTTYSYHNYSSYSYLRNCNSIITLLGTRILCNWGLSYNEKVFVKELPNENIYRSNTPIIMYEKDINNNESEYNYSYNKLIIIPSEENKDITIKHNISNIEFLDKFTTPKNIYKMNQIPYNVPSQYKDLFQKLENE